MANQGGYVSRIWTDQATTSTTAYRSNRISMLKGSLLSLQLEMTGTVTGTFTLWQSNMPDADPTSDADWVENTDVTFTAVSNATDQFINIGNAAARWYMVKYTNATGTGSLNGWVMAGKGA